MGSREREREKNAMHHVSVRYIKDVRTYEAIVNKSSKPNSQRDLRNIDFIRLCDFMSNV